MGARSNVQLHALRAYISRVLGQPYSLTAAKLLTRSNSKAYDEDGGLVSDHAGVEGGSGESAEAEEMRSFFCSELCAACLKRCGVLKGAKASTKYWPGSFSQHSPEQLPLQDSAYI